MCLRRGSPEDTADGELSKTLEQFVGRVEGLAHCEAEVGHKVPSILVAVLVGNSKFNGRKLQAHPCQ